ncbi:hypothetical protein C9E85_04540 [Plesiomonas shigelloides]|nr:hypothetical protein C9E85_04540 [Plesiomonas shigelloides]
MLSDTDNSAGHARNRIGAGKEQVDAIKSSSYVVNNYYPAFAEMAKLYAVTSSLEINYQKNKNEYF